MTVTRGEQEPNSPDFILPLASRSDGNVAKALGSEKCNRSDASKITGRNPDVCHLFTTRAVYGRAV
jgi:hypothetical protein